MTTMARTPSPRPWQPAQAYALLRSGELPAIKVGGRGQWRVEAAELEGYIQRMYHQTKNFVAAHPFGHGQE